jgi:hypothetical protein
MTKTRIETETISELNLGSEDRSRGAVRGRRLLKMVALGFVFLALCLMLVDFRRLEHLAPRHESPYRQALHETRPVKFVVPSTDSLTVAAR